MLKKTMSLALALCLSLSLAACAPAKPAAKTPEELKTLYSESITAGRSAEDNEYLPIISSADDQDAAMILPLMGMEDDTLATAYGVSASAMNMRAYGIAAVMPADGKADAVKAALQGFIDLQKQNFEQYLPDQKEIANAAKLEVLADGTVLMVMCENQDTVFTAIKDAIEK